MGSNAMSGAGTGAASGALVGSVVPGIGTAIGAAVGGGIGFLEGNAADQSNAAVGAAGRAQQQEEEAQRARAIAAANPSPQEIQALQQSNAINAQEISRKKALLDSADPALMEAGKQALQLMQGKQAAAVAPLQNQRMQQRQQLQQTLRQQLGSDYATSTAGIQALNNFDQQTASLTSNVQQQTLQNFLGQASSTSNSNSLMSNSQQYVNEAGAYAGQSGRLVNAITGNRVDATLGYAGQIANANTQVAQMQGLGQAASFAALYGGGAKKDTSTGSNTYAPQGSYGLGTNTDLGYGNGVTAQGGANSYQMPVLGGSARPAPVGL